ncbi:disease resistance protein Roq1-like [Castanea sativa]|uniref:disease resistance protein Roq1-like n=1 Tax=Castanea sativa TaxID=21020 RepID=UPI003F649BB6
MASSLSSFPSSSISSTSKWTYDVFLSFSGEDTRNTATDFVDYALVEKGIKAFKDDRNIERGKTIEPELLQAIKESKFAVVSLSKNYASSTWCLNELVEIIDCKEKMGMTILPIFYNVDPSDVRNQKGTFAQRFDEYEKQFEQKVGTWRHALTHVANIAGYHVDNSPLSVAVKSILGLMSQKLSREFSEVTEGLVGIESPMLELESCLAFWLKDEVRFIGIWAMGGMGKTTLAKVAYKIFSKEFEACCFIDNVRENCEKEGELSLQKNLISQILNDTNLNIKNECEVEQMIKSRLCGRRILLVLDDVNDLNQLQKLAGKREWFGQGSRIIITTRDKHLLGTHLMDKIYEVKALKNEDALHLFCSKAFKNEPVPDEYLELSKGFLNYVGSHPLALITLGSFLSKRSVVEWENEFEKLKEHPMPDVIRVLKISYDGLEGPEQEIFKDIACFFEHEKKDYVVQILKILGRYPDIGLSILIEKSLLKISENNDLWMHDLLRDMGRDIVRQESRDEPGKRSRLWHYEDNDNVLKNDTGTKKVQAMDIRGAEACWPSFTFSKKQKWPLWNPNAFSKMSNLKFLRVRNVFPRYVPEHLPNSLRYLEWSGYLAKSLPRFQPNELVQLHLQHSKIEFLWKGMKNFDKLKSIHMAGSSDMIITPNFNGVPNLEELVLEGCSKLRELHPSIGKLKNLKLLKLKECQELTSLPNKFELKSLVTLNLTRCSKVKKIPEFVGNMKHLQELLLEDIAITELPSSVECLIGLNILILRYCKKLVCLPNTICNLTSLKSLDLLGCSKFDKLPEDLGNIVSLKKLCLSKTAIKELPSSVEFLKSLKELSLGGTAIKELPSSTIHLKRVTSVSFSDCNLSAITSVIDRLFTMKLSELFLRGNDFVSLPESISQFSELTHLYLDGCKSLRSLSDIPSKVSFISVDNCTSLERLPEQPNDFNRSSYFIFIVRCFNCFKLASNIKKFSNMFQGQSRKSYIIPGREIPKWFEKVNICDTSVVTRHNIWTYKIKKVKIQLPGSGSGCDEWRGIVLCVVFIPTERHHRSQQNHHIIVKGCQMSGFSFGEFPQTWPLFTPEYGKVDSHHLWLHTVSKNNFSLPKTPGRSVDKKGFHQVELEIETEGLEVEKIGFRVV